MTGNTRPLIGIPASSYTDPEYVTTRYLRFNGNYTVALAACGALPVAIPLDLPQDVLRALFERLDGLCLAGGVDVDPVHYGEERHPDLGSVDALRDHTELTLARWAVTDDLPVLGICRGIQMLNVAVGGNLYQHIPAQMPGAIEHNYRLADVGWERRTHRVEIRPGSRLARIVGATDIMTNSLHHQAVKQVVDGFAVVARTEDGLVEGIEHPGKRFAMAVQWHPEGMFGDDPYSRRIFEAFVEAAAS